MATFDEFYAAMNPDSGIRGNDFEQKFLPWFLRTDPEWKSQISQLWLWKDYPHHWGRDCGIDLVFRDTNGKDWAVQAKCVHPDREITKAEIDSFFSESSDKHIHGRLLIATTDRIGRNARQVIERQEKQVVLFLLDNFRKSEVEFPASLQTLLKGKRKDPWKPLPHQKRAIRDVVSGLSESARGQLIMACGTGKTLTSLWVKENLECEVTLVLVPSLSLLSQTLREWTANTSIPFKWLCVCSDATVANQDDEWVTHTSDIGVPVTGDVKEIKSFLRTGGSKVIFSTYQSSPLIAEAQKDRKIPAFNLVLADEAHRCAGKVSEAFGCVLDPKRIRADKLLFMTATPRILSGETKTAAEGRDIEVASMDDSAVFGDVLHKFTFSQAIEEGRLSDYRVEIVVVNDPLIKSQIQNRDLLRTSNGIELDAQTLASHIALAKATKKYDLRRVISFHGRVAGAKQFAADHTEVLGWVRKADRPSGTTTADYVSGDMSSGDRNTKLNRLRHLEPDERGILSNARCLSEGVDVPSLDGVAFIDPRTSQVDIVQAVGRAIRKSEGKTHGTIIIPVFIDDGENEEEALEASSFKPIWDVVNALKSHDDDLAQELDQLRISLGRSEVIGRGGLQKIVFDLPKFCSQSFADGLRTRLVERTTSSWMFWYGLLQEFVKKNGSARVLMTFKTKDGFTLGSWVITQRAKKDSLSAERRNLLESSCEDWSWDVFTDKWNEAFAHLQEFVKQNGSARVPKPFKTKGGFALGGWVRHQRHIMDSLSTERRKLLETSCKDWSWNARTDQWDEGFEQLKQYVKKNGSTRVPQSFETKDGFTLGNWVGKQRAKKDSLSAERRNLLESSCKDWSWDARTDQWNENFERLREFVKKNGSAMVPSSFKAKGGFRLGSWVVVQRHNKDSLSAERRNLLESLCKDWSWDALADQWNESFEQLKQYVKKNGSARVPQRFKTKGGFRLGSWVVVQRHRKDSLSAERRNLLESSCKDWSWDARTDQWNENFERLREFVKKNGSAMVPSSFKAKGGFRLGSWVVVQRHNKDSLSAERSNLLESSCEDWSWNTRTDQWNEAFAHLQEFVKQNGSARMRQRSKTKDGFPIGMWVYNQKITKDSLSAEKRKMIETSCKDWSWGTHTDQWDEGFEQLKQYVKKNGSARVLMTFKTKDGFTLGSWVITQRAKKDSLSAERRNLLESSCEDWSWDVFTDKWNEAFAHLQEFVKQNGSTRVPSSFKTKDGFGLGAWVGNQRRNKDSLSAEQRNLLESSCKDWTWDAQTDKWNEGFASLQEFVKKTGSARVPHTFKNKDGFTLGIWVGNQRRNKDSLSAEQRNFLESSCKDWTWNALTDKWVAGFASLQAFVKTHGSSKVPQRFKAKDGFSLGQWVATQRNTKDLKSVERRKLLESLKGWSWDTLTDKWNEAFAHLQEFVKQNGSTRVPQRFKTKDGFALGQWVGKQRGSKDSLSPERRKLLESLKGWAWDARS